MLHSFKHRRRIENDEDYAKHTFSQEKQRGGIKDPTT